MIVKVNMIESKGSEWMVLMMMFMVLVIIGSFEWCRSVKMIVRGMFSKEVVVKMKIVSDSLF